MFITFEKWHRCILWNAQLFMHDKWCILPPQKTGGLLNSQLSYDMDSVTFRQRGSIAIVVKCLLMLGLLLSPPFHQSFPVSTIQAIAKYMYM